MNVPRTLHQRQVELLKQMRSFACILFRRIALQDTTWHSQRGHCDERLLRALLSEKTASVSARLRDTVSDVAQHYATHGLEWPELVDAVRACCASEFAHLRESGYGIIGAVGLNADVRAGLSDSDVRVRGAACRAVISGCNRSRADPEGLLARVLSVWQC